MCKITQDKKNEWGEEERKGGERKGDKKNLYANKRQGGSGLENNLDSLLHSGLHLVVDIFLYNAVFYAVRLQRWLSR